MKLSSGLFFHLQDLVPDSHYSVRIAAKTVVYWTTKFSQAYHFMTSDEWRGIFTEVLCDSTQKQPKTDFLFYFDP